MIDNTGILLPWSARVTYRRITPCQHSNDIPMSCSYITARVTTREACTQMPPSKDRVVVLLTYGCRAADFSCNDKDYKILVFCNNIEVTTREHRDESPRSDRGKKIGRGLVSQEVLFEDDTRASPWDFALQ